MQYGQNIRALAVYLHEYQLVPLARVGELLSDLYGCQVSEGTLVDLGRVRRRATHPDGSTDRRLGECSFFAARR